MGVASEGGSYLIRVLCWGPRGEPSLPVRRGTRTCQVEALPVGGAEGQEPLSSRLVTAWL